jgi:hypothetical protein
LIACDWAHPISGTRMPIRACVYAKAAPGAASQEIVRASTCAW